MNKMRHDENGKSYLIEKQYINNKLK